MHSPGESLRQEREARGKTIEEMAEATGIGPHLLTALEQETFDSLPGRGFGKLYIRAYAEVLGFDPRPVIEAFDQAVRGRQAAAPAPDQASAPRPVQAMLARWRQERMAGRAEAELPVAEALPEAPETEPEPAAVAQEIALVAGEEPAVLTVPQATAPVAELIEEVPAPPLPVEEASPSRPARSRRWLVASLFPLVLLPLMAYLVFSRSTPDAPVPGETLAPTPSRPPPLEAAEPPRVPREPTTASSLEVAESGLEGEGDRFRAGQRITFSTWVLGARAGDSINHVWLRDGKVEQSIRLRLGGASWHTHSTKTLGRPGAWAVEARDEQGHVLTRADLTVVP